MADQPVQPVRWRPTTTTDPAKAMMTRTAYADQLAGQWLDAQRREQPQVVLRPGEADVLGRLLQQLSDAYPHEPLAALTDRISSLLANRMHR